MIMNDMIKCFQFFLKNLALKYLTVWLCASTIGRPNADTTMHMVTNIQTSIKALLASTASANRREINVGTGDMK